MQEKTVFDGWRSIVISLYMTLVGYGVLVGIPVISSAWVNLLGFSDEEVGRVAGADLGGLALGAVFAATVIARINRRYLILGAVALAIGANTLCMVMLEYEQVLWLRLLAGTGSGIYTAIAVATLGATSKPARAYTLMLFAFCFSQALELHILPQLSMNGIYMVFIVSFIFSLFFLHWVPDRPTKQLATAKERASDADYAHQQIPAYIPWLVLGAIVATYINIGAYWTYIELATVGSDAAPEWVSKVLVWTSFCSILGCAFTLVVSNRFGLARPLLVALVIQASIVFMLAEGINNTNILISVFSFNFLWIFIDVYQMSTVANVDKTGRFAALMPGAQGLGQLLGPNIAATILAAGLGYKGVFTMCALASLAGMSIYLYMYLRVRKTIPALADAT